MKRSFRYTVFALLYFSQGSIMAYFTALNALYLRSFGIGMGKVGLIGTIALIPFVLKIFLGMLSDKVKSTWIWISKTIYCTWPCYSSRVFIDRPIN